MEQNEVLTPEPEESGTEQIDIASLTEQQQITNEKLDTLTLQLSEQHAAMQQQLVSMYLFVMLLALLEVRKVFKGIITKVRAR